MPGRFDSDVKRRLLAGAVLATLGLGSWWWLNQQREAPEVAERPRQPDSWFRDLDAIRHDPAGRPEVRIQARYAEHFEDENWIYLHDFIALGLADDADWQVTGQRGRVTDDGDELEAHGNVVMTRRDRAVPLQLETEALFVNMQTRLAVSEERVVISRGASRMTGIGMRASLEDDYLVLEQDVEAFYEK